MKNLLLPGIIVVFALTVSGCTDRLPQFGAPSQPASEVLVEDEIIGVEDATTPAESFEIEISNFSYHPSNLTVKPGTSITVTNEDSVEHTLTSSQGLFDTGMLGEGETTVITAPTTPGVYEYFCTPHPEMVGTLTVVE